MEGGGEIGRKEDEGGEEEEGKKWNAKKNKVDRTERNA